MFDRGDVVTGFQQTRWRPGVEPRDTAAELSYAQLAAFKRDPANKGGVCDVGLWRYSRHPNYFFEWLIWIAYAVFALASPYGWIAIAMPVLMLHFLINVTGLKATEEQALRSKGERYRQYQARTSGFIPWIPKRT